MTQPELPLENDTIGPSCLFVLIPIFILAMIAYTVRIYSRLALKVRLILADYAISVAIVSYKLEGNKLCKSDSRTGCRNRCHLVDGSSRSQRFRATQPLPKTEDIEAIGQRVFGVFLVGWIASCGCGKDSPGYDGK